MLLDRSGWTAKVVEVDVKFNRIKLKQGASAWYDLNRASFTILRHAKYEPAPDAPYADRQKAWVKKHNIKVGSKVKVIKGYVNADIDNAFGKTYGDCGTNKYKLTCVGFEGKVISFDEANGTGIYIDFGLECYTFPTTVLEPVK